MSKPLMVLDIESTGLSDLDDKLHGIAVCKEEDNVEYHPIWNVPVSVRQDLANPSITKIAHNGRFDLRFLIRNGFEINGKVYDTMLMAQLIDENSPLGLKPLSERYLGAGSLANKRRLDQAVSEAGCKSVAGLCNLDLLDPAHPHFDIIAEYAVEDAHNTFKLFHIFKAKLEDLHIKAKKLLGIQETPLTYFTKEVVPTEQLLLEIELRGVRIDLDMIEQVKAEAVGRQNALLDRLSDLCADKISDVEEDLYVKAVEKRKSPAGKAKVLRQSNKYDTLFSWDSNQHVGKLFYEKFRISPALVRKTESGQYMLSESYLKFLQVSLINGHPLADVLRAYAAYKKTCKTVSTYTGDSEVGIVSHMRRTSEGTPWMYPRYLAKTVTGRLSGQAPNMQNLQRGSPVKRFFVPASENDIFVYADFSQIELRIAAHVSGDEKLVEAYTLGIDLHRQTASGVFEVEQKDVNDLQRQVGKTVNFLLIYDGSAKRLMDELRDKNGLEYTIEDCMRFREAFFDLYRGYKAYLDGQKKFMARYKMTFSEAGRVRRLPDMVYGDHLNYKAKRFVGPAELAAKLLEHPGEKVGDPEELFWRARRKFSHATKQGFNMPIQSLGATITKRAMVALRSAGYKLISTVHDSVIVQIRKTETHKLDEIRHILENTYKIKVPLKVEMKLLNSFDEKDVYDVDAEPSVPIKLVKAVS